MEPYLRKVNVKVSKKYELKGHAMGIYCLEQGQRDETIFTGAGDKFVAEWNLQTGMPEPFSVKMEQSIYALKFIKSQQLLLVGSSAGNLHVIDLQNKQELKNLALHRLGIFSIAYNPMREEVVTLGGDGLMAVWDATDWRLILQLPLSHSKLRQGAYSQDYQRFSVASGDGKLRIFETEFYNELFTLDAHEDGANSVAWHPNGHFLLSGGKDAHLRIWDAENDFRLLKSIPAHNFAIYSIVFSPDGKYFATGSRDKTLKIWDASNFGKPLRIDRKSYQGHVNSVNCLYWSSYDSLLCSAGDDRALMLWEIF